MDKNDIYFLEIPNPKFGNNYIFRIDKFIGVSCSSSPSCRIINLLIDGVGEVNISYPNDCDYNALGVIKGIKNVYCDWLECEIQQAYPFINLDNYKSKADIDRENFAKTHG